MDKFLSSLGSGAEQALGALGAIALFILVAVALCACALGLMALFTKKSNQDSSGD